MMNTPKLLLAVVLASTLHEGNAITVSDIVDDVTLGSYSNFHNNLFVSTGHSRGFSHNAGLREPAYQHDLARDYIASNLVAMGYDTQLDPFHFEFDGYQYTNCNNVVAIKPGLSGTNILVIGAHYDTADLGNTDAPVTNTCPGADDNASGVAALLEIATVVKEYTFRDTIYFIAFDGEEKGLAGSTHFVDTHTTDDPSETNAILRSTIEGMISVDMIAFNLDTTPDTLHVEADPNPVRNGLIQAITNHTGIGIIELPHIGASDHAPFHDAGIDTVLIFEGDFMDLSTGYPLILNTIMHSDMDSTDTPGVMDYDICTEVSRAIAHFLCDQAGVIPPATLEPAIEGESTLEVRWQSSPGVDYTLYGADSLLQTNGWDFIQHIPATNTTTELAVELDLTTVTQRMFKVLGE
ncbi:Aminopeptidase YwaD [Pontiella desulfatans]|uniref:Aminopeptidase YwaD n=1 Tax=Pontiella desulfatans TaxID=2750659 RepID=A0A6C2U9L9_PONDE|nr:M20/M25/M40 family metallo-hydrolase [Pontiella desulfatans]VGO16740.1 Aminopeptidase YwaD [Pontiella desulfatans]